MRRVRLKRARLKRVWPIGLRGRLAISIALIMLLALGITYVAVYRGTGSDLRNQTEAGLTREAESLATNLTKGPPLDPAGYTARAEEVVLAQPFGPTSRVIAISVEGGGTATNQPELLGLPAPTSPGGYPGGDPKGGTGDSGSDEGDDLESARRLLGARDGFTVVRIEDVGEVSLLTTRVALSDGGSATIRVGEPLAPVDRALDGLNRTFLLVGLLTLIVAAGAGWLLASSTTRPMRRMAGVAEGVDGGDLSARMDIGQTRNDEVRTLAESFNSMLDRLEAAFAGQQAFVADASHDLRTPLTIVKGQLEVLSRNPDPGPEEVRRVTEQVTGATSRMERLVDDLLLLARTDAGVSARKEFSELEPLLAAEAEAFRGAAERSVELGSVSRHEVEIDREQMARAVSNLVSNAVSHTVPGGRIEVSAFDSGERVEITVDDDGPGVPAGMRDRVFDRFARVDSSRSSDSGGSGLGLAIVKAITEAHGGEVGCSASPLGGARFTISLPVALRHP